MIALYTAATSILRRKTQTNRRREKRRIHPHVGTSPPSLTSLRTMHTQVMSYANPYRGLNADITQMPGPDDRVEESPYHRAELAGSNTRTSEAQTGVVTGAGRIFSPSVLPQPEDETSRRLNFLHSRGALSLDRRRPRRELGRDARDGRNPRDMTDRGMRNRTRERDRDYAREPRDPARGLLDRIEALENAFGHTQRSEFRARTAFRDTYESGLGFAKHQKHVGSSIQIKHWQLRDLVRCPFARDDVFVVKGFAVYRYDLSQQKVVDRYGFLFEPTCFGFGKSFIGVAGEVSEYAVQRVSPTPDQLFGGRHVDTSLLQHYGALRTGGHVNNAIKITEDLDGRLSAWLCNNSGHLMVMSGVEEEGELVLSEKSSNFCPVSINHCAISERERTLVYVGDSEEVFVSRATPTGYRECCTFREATDAGMSCDWDSSGTTFAVASQDGLVCVWDRRHHNAIARIPCRSAARCVKFSPQPLDLLAFTEHRNYLHLVDCRMWESRQTIMACSSNSTNTSNDKVGIENSARTP